MKILIVEDNPAVRRLIRRVAADIAEEIYECEDGEDALPLYRVHRPDLVLMDVRMVRMDGLSATRSLLSHFPKVKVIILTDYNDEELRFAAKQAGASAYALKHNLTELEKVLLEVYARPS